MNRVNRDELLLVGYIAGSFGVRGQLKLKTITDQPEHLSHQITTLYLAPRALRGNRQEPQPYQLVRAVPHKPGILLLSLKGVTNRDQADTLRNTEVYIQEGDAAPLEEGEFFLHQLSGLRVITTDGLEIGHVSDVLETGVHEVLIVKRPDDQPDALIPVVRDVVQTVDVAEGRVVIQVLEGLL